MNRFYAILLVLLSSVSLSGCFSAHRSAKPKPAPEIAADTDANFRQRWIEKRSAELAAQGTAATAARTQAETEFREQYGYTSAAQK
jgi:hypothetical protein